MATPSTPLLSGIRASRSLLLWRSGAILAAVGIASGAFGTHTLRARPGVNVHAWETASHYAILNGLALLAVSLHPRFSAHRFAGPAILSGAIVFSGSIATMVLGGDRFKWLGPITPLGGLTMIAGYLALAF
ncbi:hypothetical protein BXZ70DRAFT_928755 [Cristinia sonorae]|uniref:DUF423-domain-containing protein n=1 Tax=Cristinia sonorae TaxID=1940300 RepID=A0A8K0XS21_9AGAR|nr:hypothetical protein BXZ70DRAFT_928755 [Cristinia sonorae]